MVVLFLIQDSCRMEYLKRRKARGQGLMEGESGELILTVSFKPGELGLSVS